MWSNIALNTLTSSVLVPVYSTYENLVVSSVGLKRFNLLGSPSFSRAGMSSLGWTVNFSRYLVPKFVISALTVGISKSVCSTVFGTYRGALAIIWELYFEIVAVFRCWRYLLYPIGVCRRSRWALGWFCTLVICFPVSASTSSRWSSTCGGVAIRVIL
jgi:hypothetical protein